MTSTFDLLFTWNPKDELAPLDAGAYVSLCHQIIRHNDRIVLTSECVTLKELELQLDRLKDELEELRKEARKRFAERDEFSRSYCRT